MRSADQMMPATKKAVGRLIKELREGRGWNQTELGRRVGADQTTVSEWERGVSFPREGKLPEVAAVFEVPMDRFSEVIEAAWRSADDIEEQLRMHPHLSKESAEALIVLYRKALEDDIS